MNTPTREIAEYDVVIVGGGPSGLAAAIRLKQLNADMSVAVLEKGAEIGAHILSGAIMDPRALTELFPDWKTMGAPLQQAVTQDAFMFLGRERSFQVPSFLLPSCFENHGNYIISLAQLTRWLGQQAENLGVDIFPGFPAARVLYREDGAVQGVATGDMGIDKAGQPTDQFTPGMDLHAKYTLFAEGSRGHLGRQLIERFQLDEGKNPQSYGIGIKELWEVDASVHQPGLAVHSAGWPLDSSTYGGGFMYHMENRQIVIGLIVGLDYRNPWLNPFEEFQRLKTHPYFKRYLQKGKRLEYGARAITAGGLLSLPKTVFPGGALIGCDAGYLNASRIKGSHAAIKSGMLAAEAAFEALNAARANDVLTRYPQAFEQSWLHQELNQARNFKQWFKKGLFTGTLMTGIERLVLQGRMPWSLRHTRKDHEALEPAAKHQPIDYPKPDGEITFDKLSSVYLSNVHHEENQPAHLTLKDASIPTRVNWPEYAGPEARYCPAAVYEFVPQPDQSMQLQINAANCVHCKTCDIKDPLQNIVWVTPEGGGGPNYGKM